MSEMNVKDGATSSLTSRVNASGKAVEVDEMVTPIARMSLMRILPTCSNPCMTVRTPAETGSE
jgi:hypothetical protein